MRYNINVGTVTLAAGLVKDLPLFMRRYVDDFIDFGPGKPYYPSGLHIEYYKSLKQQLTVLLEDMMQVSYGDDSLNYVVDVGWYGQSFSLNGFFTVYLIKDYDWGRPLLRIQCRSIKRLVPAINLCLTRLKKDTADFRLLSVN